MVIDDKGGEVIPKDKQKGGEKPKIGERGSIKIWSTQVGGASL